MFPASRLALSFIFLFPLIAAAQAPPAGERQPLSMNGVLQGYQPGLLQVVSDGGEPWLVKVEARADAITYQASAQPNWLQPGMYVRFKGKFDKRGKSLAPVAEMTVFTPQEDTRLGAFPDSGIDSGTGAFFGEAKPEPKAAPKPKGPETYSLAVAGRISGVDNNKVRIAAGDAVVDVEMPSDAKIEVELNNYLLARQGDKVSVNGWYQQKGQGWANRLLVRAANPLTSGKKERVFVSPEERKKALDALDDLSAGETATKTDKPAEGEKKAPEAKKEP